MNLLAGYPGWRSCVPPSLGAVAGQALTPGYCLEPLTGFLR